jgi:DNA-binding FadR family transcriptional regulator
MQTRQFKENVKGAAAYLQQQGFDVPHTQLLEAISRGFGERNWSTMRALLETSQQQTAATAEAEAPPPPLSAVADMLSKDIYQQMWDGVFGMCSREQAESMLAETAARLAPNATQEELAETLNAIWVD